MTIREELQKLGPDAVRRAMVAFEHRGNRPASFLEHGCPDTNFCCFLTHANRARGVLRKTRMMLGTDGWTAPNVECAFEWDDRGAREALRLECIAYLAEHGTTPEPAPKKSPRVFRVAALVCVLLLLVI